MGRWDWFICFGGRSRGVAARSTAVSKQPHICG
jgi:hypothetical protein